MGDALRLREPADEADLGLETVVRAGVDLVEAARKAAEARLLLVAEVLDEDPAVLEERALVLGAVQERGLERDKPGAFLRSRPLPVEEAAGVQSVTWLCI